MPFIAKVRHALLIAARFIFSIAFVAGLSQPAHAGIAPTILPLGCYATNGCHYYTLSDVVGYRGDSPQNACDNFAQTKYGYLNPYGKAVPSAGSNAGYQCQVFRGNEIYVNGFGVYIAGAWATSRTCPAHSTLDAASGTCNCDAGYLVDATQTQCVAPVNQVTLTGPSRTKALIAGPAIVQMARVAGASGPAAGVSVTIAVTGGASVSGVTDANGQFAFTYVPPWKPTVDHLKATCSNCANAAEKDITVDPCEVCAPTLGNPVQPASGEKLQTEVDWADAAAHPLTLARSYRSFGVAESAMGLWSLPWSAQVSVGATEASVQLGEGARVLFRRTADGQPWVADGGADTLTTTASASYLHRVSDGATYAFDAAGRLAAITQRNGWVMTVQRDAGGRLLSVTNAFGRSIAFAYDAGGRIVAATLPDGSRIAYGYDASARLASVTYDANSNRLSRMEIATGEVDLEGQFDAPGASLTTSETPKVDAGSNRLLGFSLFTTSTNGALSSSSSTEVKYAVDAVGNMTSDGLRKFVYDSSNRLSKVEAVNGGDAMAYEYLHNALGQRVFKSDALVKSTTDDGKFAAGFIGWLKSNFGWLYAPGQTGRARSGLGFVYDEAGNMLAAYGNGSNFAAQQEMEVVWLPMEDGSSIPVGLYKGGRLYSIHTDHLGTPRLLTDGVKLPVWQWPYSATGSNKPSGLLQATLIATASGPVATMKATTPTLAFNMRFPGQYWDAESYLAQNWFRMYCPQCARYTTPDRLGLRGGINRFGYAEANALTAADPTGQFVLALPFAFSAAYSGSTYLATAAAAAAAAAWASHALSNEAGQNEVECPPNKRCRPCKTVSGKIVAVGTVAYRPLDVIPDDEMQHGMYGSHHNIFVAKQMPHPKCDCFWAKQKMVVKPEQIQPSWIPIEPFSN